MVWNFGMGRPNFGVTRQPSQVVNSAESAQENFMRDWQARRDALANTGQGGVNREYLPDFSWYGDGGVQAGPWAPTVNGVAQFQDGWRSQDFNGAVYGHDSGGVYLETPTEISAPDFSALNAERARKEAEFAAMRGNQTRQQQAYGQQLGGGFSGGIVNDSYSNPFAGQITGQASGGDPSMPGVTMPLAQPWGTPGFGGSGGGSIGGYSPSGMGQQQGNNQGGGWGGPFSNRNPWSLG